MLWACVALMASLHPGRALAATGSAAWQIRPLPTAHADRQVQALWRGASAGPALYRLVVIPGSGCAGMGPLAQRYFEGLQAADIWIFHKPHSRPWVATPPDQCSDDFVQYDSLARWQADALSALQAVLQESARLPVLLMGISEGAEILPALAAHTADALLGLVLLSAPGLDPVNAFQWQLQAMARPEVWPELQARVHSARPDDEVVHGRSLRYWRELWRWSLSAPLWASRWTVLQIWGDADEQVPPAAYRAFAERSQGQAMTLCSLRWPGANHALRTPEGLQAQQQLWPVLDRWARQGQLDCPQPLTLRP